jgi:FemAB-related protein (PEP-CTERM system-associated)
MEVQRLTAGTETLWNDFLARSPEATFYHQIGWRNVIAKTYGLEPVYLMAADRGETAGILPLFLIESKIFGNKLISVPYAPYGGIAALHEDARNRILGEVQSLSRERRVRYTEFRNMHLQSLDSSVDQSYVTVLLHLTGDTANLWKGLRKSMRRYVRKSMEHTLEVSLSSDDLPSFYTLYARHMHTMGSPVHSYDFFKNIRAEFPRNSQIAMIRYEDEPVSSIFLLSWKNTMIYGWGASNPEFLSLYPNYLLFWEAIKSCAERDFRIFDFGKSMVTEGTFSFKTGWGAVPRQLFYQRYPAGKKYGGTQKTTVKRRIFAGIWRILPAGCANFLGPVMRKEFP